MLNWILKWIALRVWRAPIEVGQTAESEPMKRRAVVQRSQPSTEETGAFCFRADILDELESYFRILRRFRKADKDAYDLYSSVGAFVVPKGVLSNIDALPLIWIKEKPGFGAVWFCRSGQGNDYSWLRFLYFQKIDMPSPAIELVSGGEQVYAISAYYDDTERAPKWWPKDRGVSFEFHLAISPAGKIRPLKQLQVKKIKCQGKRRRTGSVRGRKGDGATIVKKYWDYPTCLKSWHSCLKRSGQIAIEDFAREVFCIAAGLWSGLNSGIRVDVERAGDYAAFCVDMKRTAYFFKDRETSISADGKRTKIFHIVRAHERVKSSGRSEFVRFHFRGAREFEWKGYQVRLSVPGLHARSLTELSIGAASSDHELADKEKTVSWQYLGRRLRAAIDGDELRRAA